jgi:SAM-dependent methyltransferase
MDEMTKETFNALVERYLGGRLPPELGDAVSLPDLPADTQAFILRMLALMRRARYRATDFTPHLIRWLSVTVPSILPGAWGGRIPPITLRNRHKKLDIFVSKLDLAAEGKPPIFIDVGCGFPPLTAADTARNLPNWQVYGVDTSFAEYILYDPQGHYACFDRRGGFLYFQALMNGSGRALYAEPQTTRIRFEKLFADLCPLLKGSDDAGSETAEQDGNRLIQHHVRDFETGNLTLIEADIRELEIRKAKVIRCMNMLIYFSPENRTKLLRKIGVHLDDGGILISGTNGLGIQSRYFVHEKGAEGLLPKAFGFSLDNLGPIVFMPWFSIHADDPEATLLADLTGTISADRAFWKDFSSRTDVLLQRLDLCRRGPDGFLHFPGHELPLREYLNRNTSLWQQMISEGYLDGAVVALRRAGHDAWRNSVNDIAVKPDAWRAV